MSVGAGDRGVGINLLFARALEGSTCILKSKGWIGLVRIDRVVADPLRVGLWITPLDEPGLRRGDAEPFVLSGPTDAVYRTDFELGLSCGYGMDHLVYEPKVVKYVSRLAARGIPRQDLIDAVNHGYGRPTDKDGWPLEDASGDMWRVGRRGNVTELAWAQVGEELFLQLSDLLEPAPQLLVWKGSNPIELLQNVVSHVPAGPAATMRHLIELDRQYRAEAPRALPAVEEDQERLFAYKPAFAMFYAFDYAGVCVSAAMSNADLLRLVRAVATFAGWKFEPLSLPSLTELPAMGSAIYGRTFSIHP
ncbi:hypothetical protein [Niveibacterium sp. SC-1]|uniref:hypothetical protein n=1 Tax=Niveibacterium sp. SC-1 TaxID=3135646 RepID=UPI00311E6733